MEQQLMDIRLSRIETLWTDVQNARLNGTE